MVPGRGVPTCCKASMAHVAIASLYDFLIVGDEPDEGGSTDIMSMVFLITEMLPLVAVMSVCTACKAAIISFIDSYSLALLANSRQLRTYGRRTGKGIVFLGPSFVIALSPISLLESAMI